MVVVTRKIISSYMLYFTSYHFELNDIKWCFKLEVSPQSHKAKECKYPKL